MQFSSTRFPSQPQRRVRPKRSEPNKRRLRYWFTLSIVLGVALLFTYTHVRNFATQNDFFKVKGISVSGIDHYTPTDIITASGVNLQRSNVHTISAIEIESELKQKLSYVKRAHISKSIMKRTLTIQITEREPVALLKYRFNNRIRFVLVDLEGYVLEYINSTQTPVAIVTIVADEQPLPQIGSQASSDHVQIALKLVRSARQLTPETFSRMRLIDASNLDKITLQIDSLPTVWLASDLIETGLHHIDLFIKQQPIFSEKGQNSTRIDGYLDARFQDAIYWGG